MKQIHLKIANKYYGYKGIQPINTTYCQKDLDREVVPEKMKSVTKKVFEQIALTEEKTTLCPCCLKSLIKETAYDRFEKIVKQTDTNSLLGKVFSETTDLKNQYIEKTKEYAISYFKYMQEISKLSYEQLVEKFPRKYRTFDNHYHITLSQEGDKIRTKAKRILQEGFEAFEKKEIEGAIDHYINSAIKLTDRLKKKGIVEGNNLTVKNEKIGVNLEMTIKSNNIIVKAWTIIASGPIQQPHYRYLVK